MNQRAAYPLAVLFCAALAGSVAPRAAQGALAQATGGSGLSGTLSSNSILRKQQLIVDPEPLSGSTSVAYDPNFVTLTNFTYGPGYGPINEMNSAWIEVMQASAPGSPILVSLQTFFADQQSGEPGLAETGYIQVGFQLFGTAGQLDPTMPVNPNEGPYMVVDDQAYSPPVASGISIAAQQTGHVDTHEFVFNFRAGVPDEMTVQYLVYADTGTHGQSPDYLVDPNDPNNTIPASQIGPVTVGGSLVPEPSSLGVGLLMGAGALLRRRRAQRVVV